MTLSHVNAAVKSASQVNIAIDVSPTSGASAESLRQSPVSPAVDVSYHHHLSRSTFSAIHVRGLLASSAHFTRHLESL